jgi:hypothetical protein
MTDKEMRFSLSVSFHQCDLNNKISSSIFLVSVSEFHLDPHRRDRNDSRCLEHTPPAAGRARRWRRDQRPRRTLAEDPPAALAPSCVSPAPQLKREQSLWPEFGWGPKSMRPFKGIICDDISEFESDMPSHAVAGGLMRSGIRRVLDRTASIAERA